MKNFDPHFDRRDKRIAKLERLAFIVGAVQFAVGLCVFGFIAWVVVKLLQSQGVI